LELPYVLVWLYVLGDTIPGLTHIHP
jgi:hypothetical protein